MRRKVSAARLGTATAAVVVAMGLPACGGLVEHEPDLIAGKGAFVEKCGACHSLDRAGTTGVSGPDLDAAFERAIADGMKRSTIEGVVLRQIDNPAKRKQMDPETNKETIGMPADLVKGNRAKDVAAYVASVAAKSGEDTGRLAEIGAKKATASTSAKNGMLSIPTDPDGSLAYQFATATADAGQLEIDSKNDASIPHNIALEGNGVDEKGAVVQGGGVSKVQADLKPGKYTFYCSVPGHRDGGMVGELTVK